MGHKYSKQQILEGAVEVARRDGLSRLTYGRVADHLGVTDRMVVYYLPTKNDLITEVIASLGAQLQEALGDAFTDTAADHRALLAAAWPVLSDPAADPTFALFFEAAGLAAAGREPYRTLVPMLVQGWIDWAATFLEGDGEARRAEAAAAVAVLDGLLLVRQLAGPGAADAAADHLGLT